MSYTPGPWYGYDLRHQKGGQIKIQHDTRASGRYDLDLHVANVLGKNERAAANARLITAAPDLLEAAEALMAEAANTPLESDRPEGINRAFHLLEAAVAKARGHVAASKLG